MTRSNWSLRDNTNLEGQVPVTQSADGKYRDVGVNWPMPQVPHADFWFAVATGAIPGLSTFEKFGYNSLINTATDPEDVWGGGGEYTGQPTGAAETIEVFSSSADDDEGGTGLITLRLFGQLAGVEQTEDVTLNGTVGVVTTKLWDRMYRIRGLTAGSGGVNAGTITVRHSTTVANVFSVMSIGSNRSLICAFTVPMGKTLYMDHADVRIAISTGANAEAVGTLAIRESGTDFTLWEHLHTTELDAGDGPLTFDYGVVLPALTDLKVRILSVGQNGTSCSAEMYGILVDD